MIYPNFFCSDVIGLYICHMTIVNKRKISFEGICADITPGWSACIGLHDYRLLLACNWGEAWEGGCFSHLLLLSSSSSAAPAVVPTNGLQGCGKAHKYEPQLVPTVVAVAVVEVSTSIIVTIKISPGAYLVGSSVRSAFRLGPVPHGRPRRGVCRNPHLQAGISLNSRERRAKGCEALVSRLAAKKRMDEHWSSLPLPLNEGGERWWWWWLWDLSYLRDEAKICCSLRLIAIATSY